MFVIGSASRLIAVVGVAASLSLPSAAVAAPSAHTTSHRVDLGSELLEAHGASAYLFVTGGDATGASLQVWIAPASVIVDPPTLVSTDAALVVGEGDSSVSGTIDLVAFETGAPAGKASLDATLTPAGPVETTENTVVGSNRKERSVESRQPLSVSGSVSLPGGQVLVLDGRASAASVTTETFRNDPSSIVTSSDRTTLQCDWYLGEATYVGLVGEADRLFSYIDIAVVTPDGSFPAGDDDPTLMRSRVEAAFELAPAGQGIAATGGTAYASATSSKGERFSEADGSGSSRTRATMQEFVLDGTLRVELDDGTTMRLDMNADTCRMWEYRATAIEGGNN